MKSYEKGFSSGGGGLCKVPEPEKAFLRAGYVSFRPLLFLFLFLSLPSWIPPKGLRQEKDMMEMSTLVVLPSKYTHGEVGGGLGHTHALFLLLLQQTP